MNTAIATSPDHDKNLAKLLTTFDAIGLGDGDPIAGANLLAAMAITIANIARPGSGLKDKDGHLFKAGASLLVSGHLSPALVVDEVALDLGRRQAILNSYLNQEASAIEAEASKPGTEAPHQPAKPASTMRDRTMEILQDPFSGILNRNRPHYLGALTEEPPTPTFSEQLNRSRVVLTGRSPEGIQNQLEFTHLRTPLIHLGLDAASDFARFGPLAAAVMGGHMTCGPMHEIVKGSLLVTDPSALLEAAFRKSDDSSHWFGRLIWLVDGGTPLPPAATKASELPHALTDMQERYKSAMTLAWGRRIEFLNPKPTVYPLSYRFPQERWMRFLATMEPQFPGITGTARGLLATLRFGLGELLQAHPFPQGFKWNIGWVEDFAQFIVRRMVQTRADIVISTEQAWRLRMKERIVARLQSGVLDTRAIYRAIDIPAVPCRELLAEIKHEGHLLGINDEQWERLLSSYHPRALSLRA